MILIGSKAIKHWFPDFPREPKDTDYVFEDNTKGFHLKGIPGKVEYLWNPILFKYNKGEICTPDNLYTLKMSHLFWNVNFDKHEWDATWLRRKGCKLNKELFDKLYTFSNVLHGENKRSDLKMSAVDFFDNALKCEYSHDWLHTLLQPTPTYTKVLIGEVEVGEEKFRLLTEEEKELLVREEVEVMAFERWPKIDYRRAYNRILKKLNK